MKICHIIPSYYPLGSPQIVYTRLLAKVGHQVDVLALQREGEKREESIQGVNVIRLANHKDGFFLLKTAPHFIKCLNAHLSQSDYDIVHVYSFRGCSILPLLNRNYPTKWILDIRTGNIAKSLLKSNIANTITKIESKAFQNIIVLDKMVAKKVLSANTRYIQIPLGADFSKFRPGRNNSLRNALGIHEDEIVIVFSSSLEPQRHPETALEAFRIALKDVPHLKLLILGDGNSRQAMELMVTQYGLSDRVIFTGQVPYDEVAGYISSGDIGLGYVPITPQYNPQPPLKTVEYLASGLPVIGTRTMGNLRFIKDMENGLLCDDAPQSIADQIISLSNNESLRNRLATNARNSVIRYDWNRIVELELLPLYRKILQNDISEKVGGAQIK